MILLNKISERTTLSAKLRDILENFLEFFKPTKNKVWINTKQGYNRLILKGG